MPIDPSIPLQAQANAPSLQQMYSLANMAQQVQQQQQQQASQNKLKELYQDPTNLDDQGNLKQNALIDLMKVDPTAGAKVQQNQLALRQNQMHVDMLKSDAFQQKFEKLHQANTSARVDYEEALKSGMTQEQAVQIGQKALSERIDELKQSGLYSDAEQQKIPTKFDPQTFDHLDKTYLSYQKFRSDQDAQRAKVGLAVRHEGEVERHNRADENANAARVNVDASKISPNDAAMAAYRKENPDASPEAIADFAKKLGQKPAQPKWEIKEDTDHPDAQGRPTQYRLDVNGTTGPTTIGGKPLGFTPTSAVTPTAAQSNVISDDTAKLLAERSLTDPQALTGMSRSAGNMTKIENAITELAKERHLSGGQITALRYTARADAGSLSNLTKMTDSAVSFENTAIKNFDLALKQAPKAIPTDWGPWINKWVEQGETGTGNKDVPPYVASLLTAANEYAKIMSGSTGAQGSTVDSRREAAAMFSPYLSKGQITEVVGIAKKDMENRKDSLYSQLDAIKQRLGAPADTTSKPKPEVSSDKSEAAPTASFYKGDSAPPAHPDARKAPDGKWYVGPNKDGKYQPVMGQ